MKIYPKSFAKKNSDKVLNLINFNDSFLDNDVFLYDEYDNYESLDDDVTFTEYDNSFSDDFYRDDNLYYED